MGNHCVDLANFECSQTQSLVSHSKFAKNSTSTTANARILGESQRDSSDSTESAESSYQVDCHDSQSDSRNDDSNNPHEVPQTLAPLRGAEKEEKESSSAFALFMQEADKARLPPKSETAAAVFRSAIASHQPLARHVGEQGGGCKPLFAKESDSINAKITAESSRSENTESFTENAESHKETLKDSSDFIDSIDSSYKIDCHTRLKRFIRNDIFGAIPHNAESRNDEQKTNLYKNATFCNDDSLTLSLRGDLSPKQIHQIHQIHQIKAFFENTSI